MDGKRAPSKLGNSLIALSFVCLTLNSAQAQEGGNPLLKLFGAFLGAGQVQAAKKEWEKVPADELICVNSAANVQNTSVEKLIRKGVKPSHKDLQNIFNSCRQLIAKLGIASNIAPIVTTLTKLGRHWL